MQGENPPAVAKEPHRRNNRPTTGLFLATRAAPALQPSSHFVVKHMHISAQVLGYYHLSVEGALVMVKVGRVVSVCAFVSCEL